MISNLRPLTRHRALGSRGVSDDDSSCDLLTTTRRSHQLATPTTFSSHDTNGFLEPHEVRSRTLVNDGRLNAEAKR